MEIPRVAFRWLAYARASSVRLDLVRVENSVKDLILRSYQLQALGTARLQIEGTSSTRAHGLYNLDHPRNVLQYLAYSIAFDYPL